MKISEYRIAEYFIRTFCSKYNLSYLDLNIIFSNQTYLSHNVIYIDNNYSNSYKNIINNIVCIYLNNTDVLYNKKIDKKEINDYLSIVSSSLEYFEIGNNVTEEHHCFLNNFPIIWFLLRDIIGPIFNQPVENIKIITQETNFIDGCKFFKKDDINGLEYDCIYLNTSIKNIPISLSFLFIEALRANNFNISQVLNMLLNTSEISKRFFGVLELSDFSKDDIKTFTSTLKILSAFSFENKFAQMGSVNQFWWYLGLIENMLEPARGSHDYIHKDLEELSISLKEKVEKKKKEIGLNPLPLETSLRVQSEDTPSSNSVLQKQLDDVRIW